MWIKYAVGWGEFFDNEIKKPYFKQLLKNIDSEYQNKLCYPAKTDIFRLFTLIEPNDIKVVIIGQDPYHGPGQANGLAFSVNDGIKTPPSLVNIFHELKKDLGVDHYASGNLDHWAKKGVFLYNTIGSVVAKTPLSHKYIGWTNFSQNLIIYLNEIRNDIVYVLWGNYAKQYGEYILNKSNIIKGAHPSPFSYNLFKDQQFFVKINDLLLKNKKNIIDWKM
ncbi:uracil-DNA glycosylase [Spiroplasma endosymbiont of Megaselia nigra]|uniref:uracil-DNA glycosylase n=1 Tax=Spiroplasma endosymbiont of Megaselia nigra TaxID=2478537 RepID=UPI000F8839BA|nr:uracil-DNA glycosylase [Spiroplasma endosymbiont of Megaselia nigra]RUO86457.1 uracil-DNA glycosylase [Spiroplasma endosymbiont of Megaselia nigra]